MEGGDSEFAKFTLPRIFGIISSSAQVGSFEDVPLVEFMYLVFTRMPGESF